MQNILLILMICLQNYSCNNRTKNCVDGFFFKRHYDAPAPDNITFKTELSKEYNDKIPDGGFSHINFHINKKDFFKTHDTFLYIDKDTCYFSINTTYFNRKKILQKKIFTN